MSHPHHHLAGFKGVAAWFVVFIVVILFAGGPVLSGFAWALNKLGGTDSTSVSP